MKINWEKARARRMELNMTMEELGQKIGVQRSAVNKYEKGQIKNVSFDMFMKLSQALQIAPGYLMDIEGVGPNGPIDEGESENIRYIADAPAQLDEMQAQVQVKTYLDMENFKESSVGDQIKVILEIWQNAKPEAKRMITPVLVELNKLEE
jgi:repressor LexA